MIEYKLFSDNSGICSTREGVCLGESVTLKFPHVCEVVRIGITKPNESERFFNVNDAQTQISSASFGEGENKVTVYGKAKRWKCESLALKCGRLLPMGVDSSEQILHHKTEYEKLCARLTLCESRLIALEQKTNQKIIF